MSWSPARFVDRHRLAGQHRLVDRARCLRSRRRRPAPSRPAARAASRRRGRGSSGTSSSLPSASMRRAVFGARPSSDLIAAEVCERALQLEQLAEQRQRDDHRRRFEVDADPAHRRERGREHAGRERGDDAVDEGRRRSRAPISVHMLGLRLHRPTARRGRRTASRPTARSAADSTSSTQLCVGHAVPDPGPVPPLTPWAKHASGRSASRAAGKRPRHSTMIC